MDLSKFKDMVIYDRFTDHEIEFLKQSNWIESEYSDQALIDAMYAWDYFKNFNNSIFSLETILHCHYLLMKNLNPRIAGKIRNCDVWIGGCHKPFISQQLIEDNIKQFCININKSINKYANCLFNRFNEKEKSAKDLHIQFEYIHGFEDTNGRTGRILYACHRLKLNLPIKIIYEREKQEYYKWFK